MPRENSDLGRLAEVVLDANNFVARELSDAVHDDGGISSLNVANLT